MNARVCARRCLALLLLPLAAAAGADTAVPAPAAPAAALPVKVLVVNMFRLEAAPWLHALQPAQEIRVPGLGADAPAVGCTADGVCQMTTGMGHANAAASMSAVLFSGLFDLRRTYFVVAGIAGIDPRRGTIGSAAWARYAVDAGIAHEIDAREMPRGWRGGYFGIMTAAPGEMPKLEYGSEVFRLDEALLQRALALSRRAALEDGDDLRAYRRRYREAAARAPPSVIQCDTLSADTWWVGHRLGEHARGWMKLLTRGAGDYCTTQQEDNATLAALARGAQAGLIDIKRVAILRAGSDFDRPPPHEAVLPALRAQLALRGAFATAAANLLHAAMPLIEAIRTDWEHWREGVPASETAPAATPEAAH